MSLQLETHNENVVKYLIYKNVASFFLEKYTCSCLRGFNVGGSYVINVSTIAHGWDECSLAGGTKFHIPFANIELRNPLPKKPLTPINADIP